VITQSCQGAAPFFQVVLLCFAAPVAVENSLPARRPARRSVLKALYVLIV